MIPADILYNGLIYTGGGPVDVAGNSSTGFILVGHGSAADQTGQPVPGSTYDIYATRGIDQKKVIALKFQAASDNGPVWVWLWYARKK